MKAAFFTRCKLISLYNNCQSGLLKECKKMFILIYRNLYYPERVFFAEQIQQRRYAY